MVGDKVGSMDGLLVGELEVGRVVGLIEGRFDGVSVGFSVGKRVGWMDGRLVGNKVLGTVVGLIDGRFDGEFEGFSVEVTIGAMDGRLLGTSVDLKLGFEEGTFEGNFVRAFKG